MSTIPYVSYPAALEERPAAEPRLHIGTLCFVIVQLAVLMAVGMSPLRNIWSMLLTLFPSMVIALFQPFVGLCCLFAFTLFDEQVAVAEKAFTSSKFLAIFVALGFFFRCQRREYTLVPPDPITKLALIWAFFCMLSALWSDYPRVTLIPAITQVLLAGCLLMASQMIDTRARLGTVLVCVAIACLGGAVMLLVHPEGGLYEKGGRASLGRTNANIIARTLVMGIFAAVYLIWVIRSAFFRLAMMMTISITLVGILATRTRAALASFFLGLAGGVILGLRGSILQRILMFAVLTLCTVSGFLFVNYTGILGADYLERWQRLEGGASVRTYIWRTGIGMWLNNPTLGVGYGCFEQHYTSLALQQSRLKLGTEREAHNTYLRAICELGPIGVSAMMGIIIWMNIYSFRIRPGPEANLGFAIAVSISAMSIFSTLTHLKIFWYMIAVLIAMVRTIPEKERAALGYAGPYEEIPAVPNPYAP